jgi:hypothetical protein
MIVVCGRQNACVLEHCRSDDQLGAVFRVIGKPYHSRGWILSFFAGTCDILEAFMIKTFVREQK